VFAVLAAICFLISFVLHWAGKGTSPFDAEGVFFLGMIAVAVHLFIHYPFLPRRPPP
jgi:hypothetical protein